MLKFGSKHDSNIVYKCTVRLLEDTEILECEYKPYHKGKYLLEYVCQQLNLVEYDYLGLRYVDNQNQRVSIHITDRCSIKILSSKLRQTTQGDDVYAHRKLFQLV
ncbi:unnamed protein product [Acanthoscelides obtectus]|uniref:FERM domain-containing protein n=1 Tax=Acanthoscelides obtectus TaxID=200917 RepID=A0A9P0LBN4_ACAOB|nr:unnamed protein product [Acanthoscelides obtectus]CAK1627414.1 FERM domain-containing protein 3 [Acanthoscelides obtectus]